MIKKKTKLLIQTLVLIQMIIVDSKKNVQSQLKQLLYLKNGIRVTKKAVEEYKHRLYGGKDFTFASGLKTVRMPAKSTMTLDEFWEQNHMSNHTWGVTIGGRK